MKKQFIVILFILCLFAGISYYINLPDYHVFNSLSLSSQNTRDTTLDVVVYKYWKIDNTIQKIEEEHNKINGTPTTLEINLYYSQQLIIPKIPFVYFFWLPSVPQDAQSDGS